MKNNMSLLNASMMQLRAAALRSAATIEAILESPHAVESANHVDELVKHTKILAENDAAIKMLQTNFLSPLAEQHRNERFANGENAPLPNEIQEKLDALNRRPPDTESKEELYPTGTSPSKRKRQSKS